MKPLDQSILVFVHIKKTGGISLQKLLAKQFGNKFFGGHTHSELRRVAFNPLEKKELHKVPLGSCICKHWSYDVFAPIADKCNFVTVIREPISRIKSHYNFMRQHYPKGQSFKDYVRDPKNINLLSRMIVDPNAFSEIYLFEDLQGSVDRSSIFHKVVVPKTNKTRYKYKTKELDLFRELNEEDIQLYARLLKEMQC